MADVDLAALLSAWETERDGRRELRDTMGLNVNRLYQEGFADGLDHAVHTLTVALKVALTSQNTAAAIQKRQSEDS